MPGRVREGAKNAGVVTFHHLSDQTSKIMLQMDYEPELVVENLGEGGQTTLSQVCDTRHPVVTVTTRNKVTWTSRLKF